MPRSAAPDLPPLVKLVYQDRRYKLDAYQFVRAGLEYAQEVLGLGKPGSPSRRARKNEPRPARHVSGQDLCLALRQLAHQQYGYMAKLVLVNWGIRSTSDFGEIVYNLIKIGEMSKSENDRREDFDGVYDFDEAFVRGYRITTVNE